MHRQTKKVTGNNGLSLPEKQKRLAAAKTLIANLLVIRKSLTLYPPEHPQIIAGVERLKLDLQRCFSHKSYISFNIYEHDIFFENELLDLEHISLQDFVDNCLAKEIDSFTISQGIKGYELINFLKLTNQTGDDLQNNGGIVRQMEKYKIIHILVSKLKICADSLVPSQFDAEKSRAKAMKVKIFDQSSARLNSIFKAVIANEDVNLNSAEALVNSLIEGILDDNHILTALASLKNYSDYTCHHSINVTILSLLLATKIGLTEAELLTVGTGALLHDIGKLMMPVEIIEKDGPLTSAEWKLVKSHPVKGFDLIYDLPDIDSLIPVIAYEHHMGYDLSGYPQTKNIKRTHLFSRLVQVADAYDGATAHRSYHNPVAPGIVLASMYKKSGTLFDANLLRLFINSVGLYPIGSLVRISNGEIGVVIKNNPNDILRPVVNVIANRRSAATTNYQLDLADKDTQNNLSISSFADVNKYNFNMREYLINAL